MAGGGEGRGAGVNFRKIHFARSGKIANSKYTTPKTKHKGEIPDTTSKLLGEGAGVNF